MRPAWKANKQERSGGSTLVITAFVLRAEQLILTPALHTAWIFLTLRLFDSSSKHTLVMCAQGTIDDLSLPNTMAGVHAGVPTGSIVT